MSYLIEKDAFAAARTCHCFYDYFGPFVERAITELMSYFKSSNKSFNVALFVKFLSLLESQFPQLRREPDSLDDLQFAVDV